MATIVIGMDQGITSDAGSTIHKPIALGEDDITDTDTIIITVAIITDAVKRRKSSQLTRLRGFSIC